jgi:hypothetical protein
VTVIGSYPLDVSSVTYYVRDTLEWKRTHEPIRCRPLWIQPRFHLFPRALFPSRAEQIVPVPLKHLPQPRISLHILVGEKGQRTCAKRTLIQSADSDACVAIS